MKLGKVIESAPIRKQENARFLFRNNESKKSIEVFDIIEQRVVFICPAFKSQIQYVKRKYKPFIIDRELFYFENTVAIKETHVETVILAECKIDFKSWRFKKIQEIFSLLDKFKYKLRPEFSTVGNIIIVNLLGEGSEPGCNRIEIDYNTQKNSYYNWGKLIKKSSNLEDIFK